jgi:HlyD family secretion protein
MGKRWASVVLAFVGVVALAGCAGFGQATPTPVAEPIVEEPLQIIADARVLPERSVELRFLISGPVAELMVAEGDQVVAGAPLARLDERELALAVEQARAQLAQATARYGQVAEGAPPETIAGAEALVARAQADLRQAAGNVSAADVAAARAEVTAARAALAQLQSGPRRTAVDQAQAAVNAAQADLQARRDGLSAAKTAADLQLSQAANALRNAQDAYSKIYWDNRDLERLPGDLPQERIDLETQALRAVQDAEAALEQARVATEQAHQDEISGVSAAEARLAEAQARLDALYTAPDADAIAAARARIARAEAALAALTGEAQAGRVEAAAAGVEAATADLARLNAGPRETELALAQAQITAAEVALRQAELALERATLYAPFAGTVVALDLDIGAIPDPAQSAVVLADLQSWRLETSDLTELDIATVRVGDPVQITFDALPDLTLQGRVSRISDLGRSFQGDVIYAVDITPNNWDARLRWNMTATVAIGE